jgi:hypothetical protein
VDVPDVLGVGSPLEEVDEGGSGHGEVVDTAGPADGCDTCVCMPLMATAMITCPFFPSHLPRDEMPNLVPISHGLPMCQCDESQVAMEWLSRPEVSYRLQQKRAQYFCIFSTFNVPGIYHRLGGYFEQRRETLGKLTQRDLLTNIPVFV